MTYIDAGPAVSYPARDGNSTTNLAAGPRSQSTTGRRKQTQPRTSLL